MKKVNIIFLAVSMIFFFTYGLLAQEKKPAAPEKKVEKRLTRAENLLKNRLNLTDEQINKLKEIDKNWRTEQDKRRRDLRNLREELGDLMKEKNPNVSEVNKKVEQINSIQSELHRKTIDNTLERRKVFNDEQWEKFKRVRNFLGPRGTQLQRRPPMFMRDYRPFMNNRDFGPNYRFNQRPFDFRGGPWFEGGPQFRGGYGIPNQSRPPMQPRPQRGYNPWFEEGFGNVMEEELNDIGTLSGAINNEELFNSLLSNEEVVSVTEDELDDIGIILGIIGDEEFIFDDSLFYNEAVPITENDLE